jgi:hypothetical protein
MCLVRVQIAAETQPSAGQFFDRQTPCFGVRCAPPQGPHNRLLRYCELRRSMENDGGEWRRIGGLRALLSSCPVSCTTKTAVAAIDSGDWFAREGGSRTNCGEFNAAERESHERAISRTKSSGRVCAAAVVVGAAPSGAVEGAA